MSTSITSDRGEDEAAPLLGTSQRNISAPSGCISARYTLVIVSFLGLVNVYVMRVNLSVALIAMVDYTPPPHNLTPVAHAECPGYLNSTDSHQGTAETFTWDEDTQNQILSAFFYGYLVTQIPGGWFASRFGGKWLFGFGVLCTAVLTLLTPLTASAGVGWFIALRVLEGVGEGVTYPALYAVFAQWAPPLERTKMITFTASGSSFGTILANPIAGVLCDSNVLGGWPSVFYLSGVLGIIWFIFWALLIHDSPAKHPRISQEERDYIEKSIGPLQTNTVRVPVVSILTSLPVWAIIISSFSTSWSYYTLLTNLPNYLKNVLKFDISQSGFLSALPFVFNMATAVSVGFIADYLRERGYLSTGAARKIFNSIGLVTCGIAVVVAGYVGCNKILAMSFLCLAMVGQAVQYSGSGVNHLDIAPRYVGIIMGITNSASTITGFLAPTVVGVLTEDNNTRDQWQIVFWICLGVCVVGFIGYLLLGSGEVQPWAMSDFSPIINAENYDDSQYNDEHSINPDMGPYDSR